MRPIDLAFGLCLLSSTAACDRPTATEVVDAIERADADADPLAGAAANYYFARLGFDRLMASASDEPAGLTVVLGDEAAYWDAVVIERRYVRDSLPGRPCADVVLQLLAVRDAEHAVLEMTGSDFAQRIRTWGWCGNTGSEGYAAPYLWITRKLDDEVVGATDGAARVEPIGLVGGECGFRDETRDGRVECERAEYLVDVTATVETERSTPASRRLRIEPQIVPGLRLTIHCDERVLEHLRSGGCERPPR